MILAPYRLVSTNHSVDNEFERTEQTESPQELD